MQKCARNELKKMLKIQEVAKQQPCLWQVLRTHWERYIQYFLPNEWKPLTLPAVSPVVPSNALEEKHGGRGGSLLLGTYPFCAFYTLLQLVSLLELKIAFEDEFKMYFCSIHPQKTHLEVEYIYTGILS